MFLQSCCLALVLPDNKVATTEQSQEGVIYTLQSRLTLPQDLFRRTSLRKQRPQWQRARRNGCFRRLRQFYSQMRLKCVKSGQKRVIKEMITGSLSFPFSFFRPCQLFVCLLLSRLPHYLRAWNRLGRKGYGHLRLVKQRQLKSQ